MINTVKFLIGEICRERCYFLLEVPNVPVTSSVILLFPQASTDNCHFSLTAQHICREMQQVLENKITPILT